MKAPLARIVTLFRERDKTDKPEYLHLRQALDRIRNGESQDLVTAIRLEADKAKRNALKGKLPCVLFTGHFMKRENAGLVKHWGLIVLDFDEKELREAGISDAASFRDTLTDIAFIFSAWLSPSGTGVKALVLIPDNPTAHKGHFEALKRKLKDTTGVKLDESGKDLARICYESYDPDLWVSDTPQIFEEYYLPELETAPPVAPAKATDFGKLNTCANMIRKAQDGQKHHMLVKAATLAGGFIAAGLVREEDAIRILEDEIRAKPGVEDFVGAQKAIRAQINFGKTKPIYEHTAEEQPEAKTEETHGIVFLSSRWDEMCKQFKHGKARGLTTHFERLDKHFTWKQGDFTLVSGRPNSGKSEFVIQLMLIKSVFEGWKWGIFSPESYPAEEFYDTLIHALVGKSVDPAYANQMTPEQYAEAANFVQDHFFYIYPQTRHTIEEIETNIEYLIREYGIKGCLIDPFNQLSREFKDRDDQYLEEFLTSRKRFALNNALNYVMVIHPKAMKKNKDGEYDPVDFYDLAGGAMWANKTDNMIVVHRPYQTSAPENTTVEIHVKKIKKQRLVGIPGTVEMSFQRSENRYYCRGIVGEPQSPLSRINSDAAGKEGKLKVA